MTGRTGNDIRQSVCMSEQVADQVVAGARLPFVLEAGLIADRMMLWLLECDQDKLDGRITSVAHIMPFAMVEGVHPAH